MPRVLGINVYDFIPFKQLCLCTVEGSVVKRVVLLGTKSACSLNKLGFVSSNFYKLLMFS